MLACGTVIVICTTESCVCLKILFRTFAEIVGRDGTCKDEEFNAGKLEELF